MLAPRPILKRPATLAAPNNHGPHHAVHFPPSNSLTTHTFSAYSASVYDRSPIVVAPNSCALPERGCPGRTYTLDEDSATLSTRRSRSYGSGDIHPRALSSYNSYRPLQPPPAETYTYFPPPLIPDFSSSESEESDEVSSPPLDYTMSPHLHGLSIPRDNYTPFNNMYHRSQSSPSELAFLPHPSSPPTDDALKRRRRDRKHDGSCDPDRIPYGFGTMPQSTTPKKSRSGVSGSGRSLATRRTTSSFRLEDDGCLGGF
jgi:hypothetical protein